MWRTAASAERPGAMHTRARCVRRLCGHPVRSARFTSSMTHPLGNHARKRNGTCQNRKLTKNNEAQALVTSALRVAPGGCLCLNLCRGLFLFSVSVSVSQALCLSLSLACGSICSVWGRDRPCLTLLFEPVKRKEKREREIPGSGCGSICSVWGRDRPCLTLLSEPVKRKEKREREIPGRACGSICSVWRRDRPCLTLLFEPVKRKEKRDREIPARGCGSICSVWGRDRPCLTLLFWTGKEKREKRKRDTCEGLRKHL